MINIVQIQLSGKSAGSSAVRLHEGFQSQTGISSAIVSLVEDSHKPQNVTYLSRLAQVRALVSNKMESRKISYDSSRFGLYSYPILGTDISRLKVIRQADVIYIHWVQMGFMNFRTLKKLFRLNKKIFIVLHDMWFMTGGCHYAVNLGNKQCDGYERDCTNCPIFGNYESPASIQLKTKLDLIAKFGSKLEFISPSKWLKQLGEKSSILKDHKIHFIPNYFKSKNFRPASQRISREVLGIKPDKRVVCFGAVNISSVYKGWDFLKKAFVHLSDMYSYEQLEVVIFGKGDIQEFKSSIPFKIHYLGFLDEEDKISLAYKSSDVFVIPSILDNQPTTIAESMHCGVPVVGFDLCGIPEMISHKKTGYVAEPYNSYDLAKGIQYCLQHDLSGSLKAEYADGNILNAHFKLFSVHGLSY